MSDRVINHVAYLGKALPLTSRANETNECDWTTLIRGLAMRVLSDAYLAKGDTKEAKAALEKGLALCKPHDGRAGMPPFMKAGRAGGGARAGPNKCKCNARYILPSSPHVWNGFTYLSFSSLSARSL